MFMSFWYSFNRTDGISKMKFIGLENYVMVLNDANFWDSVIVTIKYSLLMVGTGQIMGLALAMLLVKSTRLNTILRSVFFVPVILSMVTVSFVWKIMFSYEGPLSYVFEHLGLSFLDVQWLTDPKYALIGIVIVGAFKGVGVAMMLYISALLAIPESIYESASIDGANGLNRFFKITIPLLIPGFSINLITATIGNLKEFEKMLILTNGGPVGATNTLGLYIIDKATNSMWVGYASAMAMLLFVTIATITYLQNRFFDNRAVHY